MTIGLVDRLADSRKVVRTLYSFLVLLFFGSHGRNGYLIGFMLQLPHYEKEKKKKKRARHLQVTHPHVHLEKTILNIFSLVMIWIGARTLCAQHLIYGITLARRVFVVGPNKYSYSETSRAKFDIPLRVQSIVLKLACMPK